MVQNLVHIIDIYGGCSAAYGLHYHFIMCSGPYVRRLKFLLLCTYAYSTHEPLPIPC